MISSIGKEKSLTNLHLLQRFLKQIIIYKWTVIETIRNEIEKKMSTLLEKKIFRFFLQSKNIKNINTDDENKDEKMYPMKVIKQQQKRLNYNDSVKLNDQTDSSDVREQQQSIRSNRIYVVEDSTETLRNIAARFGTTPATLKVLLKLIFLFESRFKNTKAICFNL